MFRLLFVFYSIPLCECECAPMVLSPCYPVLYRSFARFHPWDFCDEPDFSFRVAIFNGILCIKFTIGALTTGNIYIGTTNVHFVWELQPICPQNVHRIEITNRKSARRNGINRRDYYTLKIRIFTFTNTSSKWNGARAQEKKTLTHTKCVFSSSSFDFHSHSSRECVSLYFIQLLIAHSLLSVGSPEIPSHSAEEVCDDKFYTVQ